MNSNLKRFIDAQENDYLTALKEIKNGRKQSHWMWYIFPQIAGLGFSDISKYYAIKDLNEAREYLKHDILGERLIEISNVLIRLDTNNAKAIFGSPDDLKLKSSMTLFSQISDAEPVFKLVLDKFFGGNLDQKTLMIINSED
ncbi:DUF1810 domain-containing protein [Runella sp.]|uniref:DUF1810 domain-containing protein n=1 Tax=Runella sp. TaxID=1960881 RepID=UPI003018B867